MNACLAHRLGFPACAKRVIDCRPYCDDHAKVARFSFLSGYSARSDAEEAEVYALRDELDKMGLVTGWDIVARDVC